jgi:hypothetical protein
MRFLYHLAGASAFATLFSCSDNTLRIPGPAATVTRQDAVATAYAYTQIAWTPEEKHLRHGPDKAGIVVQTPDSSLLENGWWKPGVAAKGMPYQWGGFDTPQEFLTSLKRGKAAGDVSTPTKRQLGDAGTSKEACGIGQRATRKPTSTKRAPSRYGASTPRKSRPSPCATAATLHGDIMACAIDQRSFALPDTKRAA